MMIKVDIKNEEILSILNSYSNWFFEQDLDGNIPIKGSEYAIEDIDQFVSDEYLDKVKTDPNHIGFPLTAKGIDLNHMGTDHEEWKKNLEIFQYKFKRMLGAKLSSLHLYYPKDSFIGWHTNENCPGRNLILSYSTDGKGFFKYQDPKTKEIITIYDEPGWNAKMGAFGSEEDTKLWHCARNYGPRLTIAYVIENPAMWEDLKEELEDR